METFTPLSAAIGGALIGASAVFLMAFNGRIAGVSGIAWGAISRWQSNGAWRWFFVLGLLAAPLAVWGVTGAAPAVEVNAGWWLVVIAGLLVGYGVRIGSGCTSGHGVCGLSRFSRRSLTATLVFVATAVATATIGGAISGG